MGKLTFIIGGVRSGKSNHATRLAKDKDKKVAFIATSQILDDEMKKRVQLHKEQRPHHWQTFEKHKNIIPAIEEINKSFDIVIIDCLTIYISNLLLADTDEHQIEEHIDLLMKTLKTTDFKTIIVSNEVGLGIVPDNVLARRFRDLAGKVNQITAKHADEVIFMAAGLPMKLK
ncbi:MAG: bifunctional adenosylcobinamide kinase/adenosylcobinamide-phosphate guanylyltransferase [Candidatus Omnitrophota bacterium]|nr:bifunctional adenosylcobinamide kinase/adenosylcobinamide-phosphate guanylyltransferase [Candidatus Omnitrophota bacterium]